MYFMNFIAFIICALGAVFQGIKGNVGFCLIEIAFTLINLPYVIIWLKEQS